MACQIGLVLDMYNYVLFLLGKKIGIFSWMETNFFKLEFELFSNKFVRVYL